jgi:hypothetical protein
MRLRKVKLIAINQYPTEKPYIAVGDLFRSMEDDNLWQSHQNHFNKKVLQYWQPIKLAIVSINENEGFETILDHSAILACQFKYEILDQVLDEEGGIRSKLKTSSFDPDLCDLILKINEGVCWIDDTKHIIYLQQTTEKKSESVSAFKPKKIKKDEQDIVMDREENY